MTLVTTEQLATELGVSRSALLKWHRAGLITPELITPGNHLRWDAELDPVARTPTVWGAARGAVPGVAQCAVVVRVARG